MVARSSTSPIKIAIACQGGGSQTAFTAGALKALVAGEAPGNYRIVGLSGTSGGAICAALVWCALALEQDRAAGRRRAARMLDAFWHDNSAKLPSEWLWNRLTVTTRQLQDSGLLPSLSASPYQPAVEGAVHLARLFAPRPEFLDLRRLLETHLPLEQVAQRRTGLQLLVGAVGVRSGAFKAFDSRADEIDIDALLASASLPWLGRATPIGNEIYWDGLFSQNPPLREFVADLPPADKPDEIWIVRINPQTRASEPTTSEDIHDRRNELAGKMRGELADLQPQPGQPPAQLVAIGVALRGEAEIEEPRIPGRDLDRAIALPCRPGAEPLQPVEGRLRARELRQRKPRPPDAARPLQPACPHHRLPPAGRRPQRAPLTPVRATPAPPHL